MKVKIIDDMIDTIAAIVDLGADINSPHYKLLHQLREIVQVERDDPDEYYYDAHMGVIEDILSRAISNVNSKRGV